MGTGGVSYLNKKTMAMAKGEQRFRHWQTINAQGPMIGNAISRSSPTLEQDDNGPSKQSFDGTTTAICRLKEPPQTAPSRLRSEEIKCASSSPLRSAQNRGPNYWFTILSCCPIHRRMVRWTMREEAMSTGLLNHHNYHNVCEPQRIRPEPQPRRSRVIYARIKHVGRHEYSRMRVVNS